VKHINTIRAKNHDKTSIILKARKAGDCSGKEGVPRESIDGEKAI